MKLSRLVLLVVCLALNACACTTSTYQPERQCNVTHGLPMRQEHNSEARWEPENGPIPVLMDERLSPTLQDATIEAAGIWNHAVGKNFLTVGYGTEVVPNAIYVMPDMLQESCNCRTTFLGLTTRYNTFRNGHVVIKTSIIRILPELPDSLQVLVHEIGHALGLAHDVNILSIMYPYIDDQPWEIENQDLEYLREIPQ